MGVIVISSDLPEVVAVSDGVVVIRDGRIRRVLDRADATQETIVGAAAA